MPQIEIRLAAAGEGTPLSRGSIEASHIKDRAHYWRGHRGEHVHAVRLRDGHPPLIVYATELADPAVLWANPKTGRVAVVFGTPPLPDGYPRVAFAHAHPEGLVRDMVRKRWTVRPTASHRVKREGAGVSEFLRVWRPCDQAATAALLAAVAAAPPGVKATGLHSTCLEETAWREWARASGLLRPATTCTDGACA